jgi:BMFP domain-containing protein YqiC
MAVVAGGFGSYQEHLGVDNRRKIGALDERVTHLEARIAQLEAKLGDEASHDETVQA